MNHTLDTFNQNRNLDDLFTRHTLDVAIQRKRYQIGQSIPSLPSHGMCSGSSGGTVDMVDINAAVARCNACEVRVRIDNL
jgi:hypothetical protein